MDNDIGNLVELKRLLEDDVQSLLELTYPKSPVKERHIRQASVIVRRWLCDGELVKLAQGLGVIPKVPILNDDEIFKIVSKDLTIDYYFSGGVKFNGRPIQCVYRSIAQSPPPWVKKIYGVEFHEVNIGKAMSKRVLHFDNTNFSLDEVVRFACNKLGGAHFNTLRNERDAKLERAARFLTFGPPEASLPPGRAGTIHLELEGIGEEVLNAVSTSVIVASTLLVNVRFDDIPVFDISSQIS